MQAALTTTEMQVELGRQVRALRLACNLSQRDLARQAGVALGALKSLEADGSATLRTLTSVVLCLGRSDWLMSLQPTPQSLPTRLRAGKPRTAHSVKVQAPRSEPAPLAGPA